ncbi:MAG: hypothetical protein FP816_19425 [Desulfobacteraceae bacterium]|nr:hypothetical protein [Desulfobacteraceae bacterium]
MKKYVIICAVSVCYLIACSHQIKSDQIFKKEVLELLQKADLSPFIDNKSATFSLNDNLRFITQPKYVAGGSISFPFRQVSVYLFESNRAAIKAVNAKNNINQATVHRGNPERTGIDEWWISEGTSLLSVNTVCLSIVKGNMVLQVSDGTKRYSEIENELWDTATKFLNMLDQFEEGSGATQ